MVVKWDCQLHVAVHDRDASRIFKPRNAFGIIHVSASKPINPVTAFRPSLTVLSDFVGLLVWVSACIWREVAFMVFPTGGIAFAPCLAAFVVQLF